MIKPNKRLSTLTQRKNQKKSYYKFKLNLNFE